MCAGAKHALTVWRLAVEAQVATAACGYHNEFLLVHIVGHRAGSRTINGLGFCHLFCDGAVVNVVLAVRDGICILHFKTLNSKYYSGIAWPGCAVGC